MEFKVYSDWDQTWKYRWVSAGTEVIKYYTVLFRHGITKAISTHITHVKADHTSLQTMPVFDPTPVRLK
jgi:hypothetical protein